MYKFNRSFGVVLAGILVLGQLGFISSVSAEEALSLHYEVPDGWHHQRVGDQAELSSPGIGVRLLRVPIDEGSGMDTQEVVDEQLQAMSAPFIDGSVEGEAKIVHITGRVGSFAVFTDRTLVGKAEEPGQFKVATQGLLRTGDSMVVFTIMSNDVTTDRYKEALALSTGIVVAAAPSGPTVLSVPGTDWSIRFASPELRGSESGPIKDGYRYAATSGEGFNVSVFVEAAKGAERHEACANYYWAKSKENPLLDEETVLRTSGEKYHSVTYRLRGEREGVQLDVPNVHLYFAHGGKWVDVHVSKYPFDAGDQVLLDRFVASFDYGANAAPTP